MARPAAKPADGFTFRYTNFIYADDVATNTESKGGGHPRYGGEPQKLSEYSWRVRARMAREALLPEEEQKKLGPLGLRLVEGQKDRGHSQWPALVGGKPTRSGYDPRITTDARRGAKATGGDLRRGSSAGCLSQERANIPRTSPQPTLQIGGLRIGSGRQVEPGGNLLHQAPGTT